MHDDTKPNASATTDLDLGHSLPSTVSALSPATTSSVSATAPFQQTVLLPSPPFSPPSKASRPPQSALAPLHVRAASTSTLMLGVPAPVATAKLDISLLLKSSPSPPPSSLGPELARGGHSRASSLPPVVTSESEPLTPHHRTSVSSIASVGTFYSQQPVGSTQVPHEVQIFSRSYAQSQSQNQRAVLPPLSTASLQPLDSQGQVIPRVSNFSPRQPTKSPLRASKKRSAPTSPLPTAPPAKRQSKWTSEEDALIIGLRGNGMKWEEISKRLPGRSAISCRLHYQNYLERRSEWDEERKNRLARLYERLKPEMWGPLATELGIPWRAAEAMHWQLGEADMARRAGVVPFLLATSASSSGISALSGVPPAPGASMPHEKGLQHIPVAQEGQIVGLAHTGLGIRHGESLIGRVGIASRYGNRMEDALAPLVESSGRLLPPAVVQTSTTNQSLLPSLAELERGLTAFDDRGRLIEPSNQGYMARTYPSTPNYPRNS